MTRPFQPASTPHGKYLYVAGGGLNDWFGGSMRTFFRSPLSRLVDPVHLAVMTPGVEVPGWE